MHTRTFRCQSRLGIFGLILGCRVRNTIFPLKIYVFIHVRGSREWRTLVDRGRLRAGSLFAFSPLLTSYSRAYFLRQPSRIVNVNAHFFHTLPPITAERKKRLRIAMHEKFDSSSILNKRIGELTINFLFICIHINKNVCVTLDILYNE